MHFLRRRRQLNRGRSARKPIQLEGLEDRILLYNVTGDSWVYPERVTFSFAPDGVNVLGFDYDNDLNATLDAEFPTEVWKDEIRQAFAIWSQKANIDFAEVPDGGQRLGYGGYAQQGDPNVGDIRIFGTDLGFPLAGAFYPPPSNGSSMAGDIIFNTNQNWDIDSTYDLQTVAIHEVGHAIGMAHADLSNPEAVMYSSYNALKQTLSDDDRDGVRSIYGKRPKDDFDSAKGNGHHVNATDITHLIDSKDQIETSGTTIHNLNDVDWYKFTFPQGPPPSTMEIRVQSENLSLMSPRVEVYKYSLNNGLVHRGTDEHALEYGAVASVDVGELWQNQVYYVRVSGVDSAENAGATAVGAYSLLVNMGNKAQPLADPPDTYVPAQADQGGGGSNLSPIDIFEMDDDYDPSKPSVYDRTSKSASPSEAELSQSIQRRLVGIATAVERVEMIATSLFNVSFDDHVSFGQYINLVIENDHFVDVWFWYLETVQSEDLSEDYQMPDRLRVTDIHASLFQSWTSSVSEWS